MAAIGFLSLASSALVGCNQESQYCDDTGCYYCDGLGCRLVNPPSRPSCSCPYQCGTGTSCTALGCVATCNPTAANPGCPDGTTCRANAGSTTTGLCLGPRETAPSVTTCACSATADCASHQTAGGPTLICRSGECAPGCSSAADCEAGQVCRDGACSPGTPACDATHACQTGFECIGGECRPSATACQFSSECGAGYVCVNQQCVHACDATHPCTGSSACGPDGFCHEVFPPPSRCVVNADCSGANNVCIDGTCWQGCAIDADCPTGDYCNGGVCRLDDRPNPACGTGRPCAAGSVCHNGACRSPCTMDAECPRFDVQTNFCIMNVCSTTNEATSNCMAATDCMANQSCVDGVCH
jgi:hypothetical protein